MIKTIISLSALLLSFGILCLGHGLQNTILGLRAIQENYPDWIIGVMMSAYFIGFLFGTKFCGDLIPRVGSIRAFAAFASIASSISLIHVMFIDELVWILCRFIYGICISSLYMILESWLNGLSTTKNRGQILSLYMIISFLGLSLSQTLVTLSEPSKYVLFALASILISLSLVPLSLGQIQQPEDNDVELLSFDKLFKISPLATLGSLGTGLVLGAFWGLSAAYFFRLGLPVNQVALVIGVTYIGGLIFQYPIGFISDQIDRRIAIVGTLLISIIICILITYQFQTVNELNLKVVFLCFFFGGFVHTLYSLFIALANDFLKASQVVQAAGGLISINAIGSSFGPLLAGLMMTWVGNQGLFWFIAIANSLLLIVAIFQSFAGKDIPEETSESYIAMPRTSTLIVELDPRQE